MKSVVSVIGILMACFSVSVFAEEAPQFVEGKQYLRAPNDLLENKVIQTLVQQGKASSKIQVLEFFSYACHWCYKLDPAMENWSKKAPKYVEFQRVPVEFQSAWRTLTKSYYTAIQLNAVDKIHRALFDAIFNEKLTSSSEETLQKFFEEKGIKADAFKKAFNSPEVAEKQKWANDISRAYRITAIPAVVVQGPQGTFITSIQLAGGEKEVVAVVDYLTKMQTRIVEIKKK